MPRADQKFRPKDETAIVSDPRVVTEIGHADDGNATGDSCSETDGRSSLRIAINAADLTRVDALILSMLLSRHVDITKPIITDVRRPDEMAVEIQAPLITAANICDVIRMHDRRAGDHPTRVYVCRRVAWEKVPSTALLCLIRNGECVLNPAVFPVDAKVVKPTEFTSIEL
jgi:hypothetical protein